eukprot:m.26940 g.26940  ORF g.26940 m.26940 type:complete len:665 (-) comp5901_c2_seq2:1816-3810(-)
MIVHFNCLQLLLLFPAMMNAMGFVEGGANKVVLQPKRGSTKMESLSSKVVRRTASKCGSGTSSSNKQLKTSIAKTPRRKIQERQKLIKSNISYQTIGFAIVVLVGFAFTLSVFDFTQDPRIDPDAPLDRRGLPAPRFDAPLAEKHEALRNKIMAMELTVEERKEKELGHNTHRFNQFISDRLPLDRQIKDMRQDECFDQRYYPISELPTTSVILIFHNEAMSTLLRTAHSVLRMSPPELLTEIIFVDDCSTGEWLGSDLDEEVKKLPKTRLLRLPERHGLIKAKIEGAKIAKGDTITFLDSHCECNPGWLEPLLDRVKRNRYTVAVPTIDTIDYADFSIVGMGSTQTRGIFTWHMQFSWKVMTTAQKQLYSSIVDPFKSPAMAGGLFTMDRNAFFELGAYDEGQHTWGGENLEMSFRIWMCGGQIESVPCSRVAHVFRETNPVKFKDNDPSKTITRNLRRVSDVWMDEYAQYYYMVRQSGADEFASNVTERKEFRDSMNCHSFSWYVENVFPDLFVPSDDNMLGKKTLYNVGVKQCLDTHTLVYDDIQRVFISGCVVENGEKLIEEQTFYFARDTQTIRHIGEFGDKCLRVMDNGTAVRFIECDDHEDLVWDYDDAGRLIHKHTGACLEAQIDENENIQVVGSECDWENPNQEWDFLVEADFDV